MEEIKRHRFIKWCLVIFLLQIFRRCVTWLRL
uniref:Uncharacterized protein n=1 Tax=Siphoviridae sp. ctLeh52 TaxID=2827849 RepID=A0A8S5RWT7_9CAUD|nr:MAG TPA: hypothetical protein [Siphoviridae sp. ctLeh52]